MAEREIEPAKLLEPSHVQICVWGCTRVFLLLAASIALVWWLDPALRGNFAFGLLWRNAFPVALLTFFVYGMVGRWLISLLISAAVVALVFNVNAIKLLNMDAPLQPGDLLLGQQVLANIGFFAHYTGHRLTLLLFAATICAVTFVLVWRLESRRWMPSCRSRLLCIGVSLILVFTLFSGRMFWARAYDQQAMPGFEKWNPALSVRQTGFLASFVRMAQEVPFDIPEVDAKPIAQFAAAHRDELQARASRPVPAQLPDIVVVQSEAFFDPGVMRKIDYGQYAPNFERLARTGMTGSLTTPTYGGGTIRTEFETLTGYPMWAFPGIAYPYFGLAGAWMPTVPHRLQAFGYTTTLFHPFQGQFWNRQEVMPGLGFQRSFYESHFGGAARAGEHISDRALFDFVLAHLEGYDPHPRYTMVITMENHGPWRRDPGELAGLLKNRPLPDGLSRQGTQEMDYYLAHLLNGDAALGYFAQQLLARPRWTILIFYGDHLPALSAAFNDIGFDDDRAASDEHTRYMLISNRPLKAAPDTALNLAAYDLPGLLFDSIGLPEDGYLAMSSLLREDRRHRQPGGVAADVQLQFDTAILEIRCRRTLDASEACSPKGTTAYAEVVH